MTSSIDDEFESLFLPDLELLNSLTNNNNNNNNNINLDTVMYQRLVESTQQAPFPMDNPHFQMDPHPDAGAGATSASSHQDPTFNSEETSNAHWLHHYDKFNRSYGYLLNQVRLPSYMLPPAQMSMVHGGNQQLILETVPGANMGAQDYTRPQESMEYMAQMQQQQQQQLQQPQMPLPMPQMPLQSPPAPPMQPVIVSNQSFEVSHDMPRPSSTIQERSKRQKKEGSAEHADFLDLIPQKLDESTGVFDIQGQPVQIKMTGEMDGRLLYSPADVENAATTTSLTCYRRNYIRLKFNVLFEGVPSYISVAERDKVAITKFKVSIFAKTSFSDDKVNMIINKNKSKKPPGGVGGNSVILLDSSTYEFPVEVGVESATKKFLVKKTQFRNATPNSSKGGAIQNYYYIVIMLTAVTPDFGEVPLMMLKSMPLKVRGRNPSFYNNRKDVLIIKNADVEDDFEGTATPNDGTGTYTETGAVAVKNEVSDNSGQVIPEVEEEGANSGVQVDTPGEIISQTSAAGSLANVPTVELRDPTPSTSGSTFKRPVPPEKPKTPSNYEYFPLSNVYYLPPLDAHYFPHGIHHPRQSSIVRNRRQSEGNSDKSSLPGDIQNSPSSISSGDSSNRYIKMKLMNILNDSNGQTNRAPQRRYFDYSKSTN